MDTVGALVRRGTQIHQDTQIEWPAWAAVVLVVLGITYLVTTIMVHYTFGKLIPTLIMVEDPDAAQYETLDTSDSLELGTDKKISGQAIEPETVAKPRPVTYNFRTTLNHLRTHCGRRPHLRGIGVDTLANIVIAHLSQAIGAFNILPFRPFVAPILATTIASHLPLLWTHIAITEPGKRWYKRFAPLGTWKKIARPTAISMTVQQVAVFVPMMLLSNITETIPKTGLESMNCDDRSIVMLKIFGVAFLSPFLQFVLVIPAKVSLTRVQASLLSQEEQPVVPFDRSFDGKVVSTLAGGSGVLGMADAWRTFTWSSRVRLVKAYLKVVAIQIAFALFFSILAIATAVAALGVENLNKYAEAVKNGNANVGIPQV